MDGTVLVWDVEKGVALLEFYLRDFVYATKLLGDVVAVAQKDGQNQVGLYDVRTGSLELGFTPHCDAGIRCLDYDGKHIMAGTFNAQIWGTSQLHLHV